jgi:hypothetical protein
MSKHFGLDDFLGTYDGKEPDRDAWLLVDSVRFLQNSDDREAVKTIVSRFNLDCPINYELRSGGAHDGFVPSAIKETLKAWPNVIRNMEYLAAELNFTKLARELSHMSLEQINLDATFSMPSIGVVVPLKPAEVASRYDSASTRPEASAAKAQAPFFVLNT